MKFYTEIDINGLPRARVFASSDVEAIENDSDVMMYLGYLDTECKRDEDAILWVRADETFKKVSNYNDGHISHDDSRYGSSTGLPESYQLIERIAPERIIRTFGHHKYGLNQKGMRCSEDLAHRSAEARIRGEHDESGDYYHLMIWAEGPDSLKNALYLHQIILSGDY